MNLLVTVYITTHNRGDKITRAIDSVLRQSYKNIELIISDDGSSDNTEEICRAIASKSSSIKYIRVSRPQGANHARNLAIKAASGVFITGLDDDDIMTEDRIMILLSYWDDKYSFVCDNFLDIYKSKVRKRYIQFSAVKLFSLEDIARKNCASNQIFTKTARLKNIYGFDESVSRLQDWDCWLRMVDTYGDFIRVNHCTYWMFHDEVSRVSINENLKNSYEGLIRRNYKLFSKVFGEDFVDIGLIFSKKPRLKYVTKIRKLSQVKLYLKGIREAYFH
ncbi:hypothetical protein BCS98_04920 [Vibrio breoganii]|uniref:glycosyltransferase family 2 protein n=1 Tax=Vibrio breoganii TaxID=553239 RepID=UPI000C827F77|nr:glycosyltransferase family 2 protein [Vibrio breoganii]PMO94262.1 hypothetical protein BCS98_04920 [Vibrio breoganii]